MSTLLLNNEYRDTGSLEELLESDTIETVIETGEGDFVYQKKAAKKSKLCIPSLRGFRVVDINTIIYCEASSNYTNIHFTNGPSICTPRSIFEYEDLLEDCNFVRIHKSFVVNLEHVKEYIRGEGGTVILSNGHEVDVSRRKKDLLMTRIKDYYKF